MAEYGRFEIRTNLQNQPGRIINRITTRGRNASDQYGFQRSFPDVLKTGVHNPVGKTAHTIQFKAEYSLQCIKSVLKEKGLGHVLVRNGRGRIVVMSFLLHDDMMSSLSSIKAWFQKWCEFVKVWEPGLYAEQESCLWLRCHGVPLSMWNRGTFN
ncbi:hypothetical protein ACSBR1_011674 [Camellia fascicularis]